MSAPNDDPMALPTSIEGTSTSPTEKVPTNSDASTFDTDLKPVTNASSDDVDLEKQDPDDTGFHRLELARIRSGASDLVAESESEVRAMSRVESHDPNVVGWDGPDDPANPFNFSNRRKWCITMIAAMVTFCVAFASSVFTAGIADIAADFGVSTTVATLGLTVYILGFAFGPMVFAPISEVYGRNVVYLSTWFFFTVFQIPCALSKNIATLLVSRAIAGIAGSSPLSNAGATLGDIWSPAERGDAMSFYTIAPFAGPVVGPIIGGYLSEFVTWRWTFWLALIFAGVMAFFLVFFMPETYSKTLLEKKAARLRKETGNMDLRAAHERQSVSHADLLKKSLVRPVILLFTEPIVFLIALYCSLIYAILYMNFVAYPIIFQQERGWGAGKGGLPFIALGIGMVGGIMTSPAQTKLYIKISKEKGNGKIYPEARLPYAIFAAFLLPIGVFWLGWGSLASSKAWIVPVLSGIPFGFGLVTVFLSMFSYLVDTYLIYAASALAANSLLRSILGATFPLFADKMYEKLTPKWACTLIGCLALVGAPIPFLFYKYGPSIRSHSRILS
ncbi:major facilitator superfamily protein [Myxozyma melibiosi]|uniref:Major facilitator superfamily protein n=1 Tax=Myxozyma melibiosi TaxID=54550 RepID=A0ABR1F3K1_9ASCO